MPSKPTSEDLDDYINYYKELINLFRKDENVSFYNAITEKMNYLEEIVNDDIENKMSLDDEEARGGHKTADTSFLAIRHILQSVQKG